MKRILIKSCEIEVFFKIGQKWLNIGNCIWFNLSGRYAREWLLNDFNCGVWDDFTEEVTSEL